jgi:hypothetical protein
MQHYKQAVALLSAVLSIAVVKAEAACTLGDVAGNWRALVLPVKFQDGGTNDAMCLVTINRLGTLSLTTPTKYCLTAQFPPDFQRDYVVNSLTGKVKLVSGCNYQGNMTIRSSLYDEVNGEQHFINYNEFAVSLAAAKTRMDGYIQIVTSKVFYSDPSLFMMIKR